MRKQIPMLIVVAAVLAAAIVLADDPQVFEDHVVLQAEQSSTGFSRDLTVMDFNDNTFPDLLVSEPHYEEDWRGRVLAFFDVKDIPDGMYTPSSYEADLTFLGQIDDALGWGMAACDFNGDDVSDIVFNRTDNGGRDELYFIFYGGDNWTSGTTITDIDGEADVIVSANPENENIFASHLICRDLDDDGYDDLFAGTYPALVLGGNYPSGSVIDLEANPPAVRFTGNDSHYRIRFFGDVNGDGNQDFLFSDNSFTGEIRIWFGFDDYSTPRVIDPYLTPPDVTEEGPYIYAYYQIADVGDWDGDGADDILAVQAWEPDETVVYRLNPGAVGMEPGHEFVYQFAVMVDLFTPLRLGDLGGDSGLDLFAGDESFYWDRSQFPQSGNWNLWEYDPQGIHEHIGYWTTTQAAHLDTDGIPDAIFSDGSDYGAVALSFTGQRPNDDDDDDNDTGPDDDDNDDDNDTGSDDDDDDTGSDDDDDNDDDNDDDDDDDDDDDNDDTSGDDDDDDDNEDDNGCCG